jgi:hypothetical protein
MSDSQPLIASSAQIVGGESSPGIDWQAGKSICSPFGKNAESWANTFQDNPLQNKTAKRHLL